MIALMIEVFQYLGILLIIISMVRMIRLKSIEIKGLEVEAIVVDINENRVRTGRQVYDEYTPILEYVVAKKVYRKPTLASQGDKRYHLGQVIRIRCKPGNPEDFLIPGDLRYYFNPVLIGMTGIMIEVLVFLLIRFL